MAVRDGENYAQVQDRGFSAADSPNIPDLGIGAGRQYQLNPRAGLFPENNRGGGFKNREDLSLWLMSL